MRRYYPLTRQKKRRVGASKKSKPPGPAPRQPYEPPPDAPVRQLQPYIKYSWKVWWNDWIGDPFLSKKKKHPGDKGGAKCWVREQFCGPWWKDNMPGCKISERDKLWYFDHTKVGEQIYAYLHNSSVRGSKGRDPDGPDSNKVVVKRGAAGYDLWRRENVDLYEKEVRRWKTKHKREPNFGELRKISGIAFRRRSQGEQDKWNRIAKEVLKADQQPATSAESDDQAKHYDKYCQKLDTLMAGGEKKANIRGCALVLRQKPDGGLQLDWKVSESLQEFTKSPLFAAATRQLQAWVEEAIGDIDEWAIPEAMDQQFQKKHASGKDGKRNTYAATDDESLARSGSESDEEELYDGEFDKSSQTDNDDVSQLDPDETFGGSLPGTRVECEGNDDLAVDQLELRHRYGFTWVNMLFESHGSDASHRESLYSWSHRDAVFGQFSDLPPYEPISFHTPKDLVVRINAITKSCKEAMDELYEYLESNSRIPSKITKEARSQADNYPDHQALYEYILLCRAVWTNAAQVAVNGIFGHGTYIALIIREAAQAQLMAQNVIEQDAFPDPDVGPTEFADAIRSANKAVAELEWTFHELCSFQQLATKWYNSLQGNWLYGEITNDLPTLVQTVKGLLDWAGETTELIARLWSDRRIVWEKQVGELFDPNQADSGMLYRFGCPCPVDEPAGLRDAFKRMRAMLPDCAASAPSPGPSNVLLDNQIALGVLSGKTTSTREVPDRVEDIPSLDETPPGAPVAPDPPNILENKQNLGLPWTSTNASSALLPSTAVAISSTSQLSTSSSEIVPRKRKREADSLEAPPEKSVARITPTVLVKPRLPRTRATTKAIHDNTRNVKRGNVLDPEAKSSRSGGRNARSKRTK
ncbi:unnamed protein product [Rhizoctonia solani]|uniref:Uncharacterized protein n=1 Tax=Rhizoctonia solani TaxID=456999 RepID=A0A8H3E9U5_9AGAM|nr:unnamed protein product [Rhizoctonia solani]